MIFLSLPLFRLLVRKPTFFGSGHREWIFVIEYMFSYGKKSEKNIGEKIYALSIAIFSVFTMENFSFFLYFFVNRVTSLDIFNQEFWHNG